MYHDAFSDPKFRRDFDAAPFEKHIRIYGLDWYLRRYAPHIEWEGDDRRQVGVDGGMIVAVWREEHEDLGAARFDGPVFGPSGVRIAAPSAHQRRLETLRAVGVLRPDGPLP